MHAGARSALESAAGPVVMLVALVCAHCDRSALVLRQVPLVKSKQRDDGVSGVSCSK